MVSMMLDVLTIMLAGISPHDQTLKMIIYIGLLQYSNRQ